MRVFRFSGPALTEGIEAHRIDGLPLRVYSAEKTIADCFKFRNKIGLDVAIEALRRYLTGVVQIAGSSSNARACRVAKVMTPYLGAMQ